MDRNVLLRLIVVCVGVVCMTMCCLGTAGASKLDYAKHKVTVTDESGKGFEMYGMTGTGAQDVADGLGADPMPCAWGLWMRKEAPTADKPAVLEFDYGTPVKVAALAHYFYVPGCRDHRWQDWLSGPSAFGEVRIYVSDDNAKWTEVSHLTGLPAGCPQLLKVERPTSARYLKLEVLSLIKGAEWIRSYEIETYLDSAPKSLPSPKVKPVRHGFPYKAALMPVAASQAGDLKLAADARALDFSVSGPKLDVPARGRLSITIDDQPVAWKASKAGGLMFTGSAAGRNLKLSALFVKAGLLLKFSSDDPVTYPFPKLDVVASMDKPVKEVVCAGVLLQQLHRAEGGREHSIGDRPDCDLDDRGWEDRGYARAGYGSELGGTAGRQRGGYVPGGPGERTRSLCWRARATGSPGSSGRLRMYTTSTSRGSSRPSARPYRTSAAIYCSLSSGAISGRCCGRSPTWTSSTSSTACLTRFRR